MKREETEREKDELVRRRTVRAGRSRNKEQRRTKERDGEERRKGNATDAHEARQGEDKKNAEGRRKRTTT